MIRRRYSVLMLVGLDCLTTVAIFNIVSYYYGVSNRLILLPLAGPIIALTFFLYLIGAYRSQTEKISLEYVSLHGLGVMAAWFFIMLATFALVPAGYALQSSRLVIFFSFALITPVTLTYRQFLHHRFAAARGGRSIVFAGDAASCVLFRDECAKMEVTQPIVFLTTGSAPPPDDPTMVSGSFDTVLADIDAGRLEVEAIVLRESSADVSSVLAERLVRTYFSGIPTYTLELFHQVYWQKIPLYRLNPTWLFQEGFQIAREPVFERLKRQSDVALTLIGLLAASPLILLAGVAIWLEDRGPVLFFQTRIGRNHVPFRLVKLRTMTPNDGKGDPYTRPGDARVTRVGKFLRATRLDELPQLWNVLVGDMSLIGPRPEWDRLVVDYESRIPCYSFRHLVRPGITGWAQVNYRYGACFEDTLRKLEYDLYYIRHFSFVLDASIILKTIQIMIFGKGR